MRYDTFHYVPLLKTVERLLQDDSVLEEIQNCSQRVCNDDCLEDFCDGDLFQCRHELFSSDPHALQIIGYFDELEITNPLGAYVKKHKVGVVSFFLGNIHPKYRSRLCAVNLVAVAKVHVIEKYGINEILKPFVEDLNQLATVGVSVNISCGNRTFKGALLAFLADTQAAHLVGGFKKSVGLAYRMCRTCMATSDSFKVHFNSTCFTLRDTTTHKQQCSNLLTAGPLKDHYSKIYGVTGETILLGVKHYSLCDWGLPHDVMHDLFEGVVQYEIKLLLLHCVDEKYFSLTDFNNRLLSFKYGYSEVADKPVPITTQHLRSKDGKHIRQGSAQTWLLARILPYLVARNIPDGDDHWKCYLKLLKIIDFALAPIVSRDVCALMKVLIEEHHMMFVELYPDRSVTPKMHYMTHYPEQILALGPLVRTWTMRCEAKLHLLKCAGRVSNFKNISQSIATRHQRWMCFELSSSGVLESPVECGPVSSMNPLNAESTVLKDQILKIVPTISDNVLVSRVKWTKINGITYRVANSEQPDAFVICSVQNKDMAEPTVFFGHIQEILTLNSDFVLFFTMMYKSSYYDDHYHGYILETTAEQLIIPQNQIMDPVVLHCHHVNDKLLISLKYYVPLH